MNLFCMNEDKNNRSTIILAVTKVSDKCLELREWINKSLNEKSMLLNDENSGSESSASRPNLLELTSTIT